MNHAPQDATFTFYVLSCNCYRRTTAEVLVRPCRKEMEGGSGQIPITNFAKKSNISFTDLHYVKYYFCEIFSFDAVLYFLHNLISQDELIFTLVFFITLPTFLII
jgi:hypothetical protein